MEIKLVALLHLALAFVEQGLAAAVASIESTCPLASTKGISDFLIRADSPLGRIPMMLVKFDNKRKLPFATIAMHDQLNTQKNLVRASVAEPFGPINATCPSLAGQFNCTGGISMTAAQKVTATPRYTWDRGHLTPANPFRYSEEALNKTFYCVNLAAQDSWTNQNAWKDIELFAENKLATMSGYVMTGLCSTDNWKDGPTTYRGYTIPSCFWKMTCYKDKTTKEVKVVGYIGDNTIVNFSDTVAQTARKASTFQPKSQADILTRVNDTSLVTEAWTQAEDNLLTGRQTVLTDLPKATECAAMMTLSDATKVEWTVA